MTDGDGMQRRYVTHNKILFWGECAAVCAFLLIPPLFSDMPFTLPPKPEGLYAQCIFCFSTVCAAAYEEVLYRLYVPNRLHRIYTDYIEPRRRKKDPAAEDGVYGVPQRSLPQLYHKGTAAVFFTVCCTELPALLLFTFAHRYLGLSSMLFAAGAGTVLRIAYLNLKRVVFPAFSITLTAVLHGLWNIGVYYYLWKTTAAV